MVSKLLTFAAWTCLVFIAYATLSPISDRPTLPTSVGFERLAAFAVLGVLFCLAYPRQFVLVCFVVLASALLLEFAQQLTPDRHGRIQDAVVKLAGGVLGIGIGQAILYFDRFSGWFRN
jgi:VanZ family protein